ncbi:hypothetical protein NQ315_014654 [Exocentrus adspersus]|uniref:SWIM-type domain-containing protein n=1 Tax=Exocentrus adspersus TaxID=1586481 RepID=A0AAV8VPT4_9CUCU|nr:hypothetical protein NQ315_014654 [Exocentrus adspersus]
MAVSWSLRLFRDEKRKTKRATKPEYGDNAVSYVQLKREGSLCEVRCKITPEHNVHKKGYNVIIIINETVEEILTCKCTDCAASLGGCKHAVAFLFWLHRRSEEPSVTSKECYWKASKLSKVGSSDKFMTLHKITGKQPPLLGPKSEAVVKNLVDNVENRDGGVFSIYNTSDTEYYDIYQLILKYKAEVPALDHSADHFINFVKQTMGDNFSYIEKNNKRPVVFLKMG